MIYIHGESYYSYQRRACFLVSYALTVSVQHVLSEIAWLKTDALSSTTLDRLEEVVKQAEARLPASQVRIARNFGEYEKDTVGHAVTSVTQDLIASFPGLEEMRKLALLADVDADWNVSKSIDAQLHLRCAEFIEYSAKDEAREAPQLSWHHDGQTVITVAVMLTSSGSDFEGGEFEVRRLDGTFALQRPWRADVVQRGDVIAWRGWDEHRVHPVKKGVRRTLVMEWWLGHHVTADIRPSDTEEGTRSVLLLDPGSPALLLGLAEFQKSRGKLAESMESFKLAMKSAPAWEYLHGSLGELHAQRGAFVEAFAAFESALNIDPASARAHSALGRTLASMGRYTEALGHLSKAREMNPTDAESHYHIGMYQRGSDAFASLTTAVKMRPGNPLFHLGLGLHLAQSGKEDDAEKAFVSAESLQPGMARYDLGVLHSTQGRLEEAMGDYRAATRLDPLNARPYVNLASLLLDDGMLEEAQQALQSALDISPHDAIAFRQLARLQGARGDHVAGIRALRRALQLNPLDDSMHLSLGLLLLEHGSNVQEARSPLIAAVRLNPADDEAHFNLGLVHKAAGDFKAARRHFIAATELNEHDAEYDKYLQQVDSALAAEL
eukprot:TRINITY_DN63379_c0_g1_i1.p1 TRINITY_DN63379_c0_g1~~TRINITY_DN63379_c0_g1_i1.p1  ORF type:complete len:623 (-),score=73.19 TRINITY_DN63379_c0_g1_i1:202-2028(-)